MSKRDTYRALVYFRQSVIQHWLGKNNRIRICVRHVLPEREFVGAIKKEERAKFINLMLCKSYWICPFCANIASTNRRNAIQRAIAEMTRQGYALSFVTYTAQHDATTELKPMVEAVLKSHAAMHSGKGWKQIESRFGWAGSVKICEVTHGRNGWHFHLHEGAFIEPGASIDDLEALCGNRWRASLANNALFADKEHGLKAQDADAFVRDYLSKWGIVPELGTSADKKAKRGGTAPFQFPDIAAQNNGRSSWAQGRFTEFAAAVKGRKQIWASPNVRKYMATSDELKTAVNPDERVLAKLSLEDWSEIKYRGIRALFLSYFEHDRLDDFLNLLHNKESIPSVEVNP